MNADQLKKDLIRDEGYRLTAYPDSDQPPNWTIGIGHLLGSSPRMSAITPAECDALYAADAAAAEQIARGHVTDFDGLSDPQQRAITNMAFNLGNRIGEFGKMLAALNAKDFTAAAHEATSSSWASEVGQRATRIAGQFVVGLTTG